MKFIYEPKGQAREYAQLASNVYNGCSHGCTYCYAPRVMHKTREDFAHAQVRSGNYLRGLRLNAQHMARNKPPNLRGLGPLGGIPVTHPRVLLSFTCDPYQPLDTTEQVTRSAIETLHEFGIPVQVLTKGGIRALRDLDLFGPEDAFATTLTLLDAKQSLRWEPLAATPTDRIDTLAEFYRAGIMTWVSLEPVLDPRVTLDIIRETHTFVDHYKIGKLNYHTLADKFDWRSFGGIAKALLRSYGFWEVPMDADLRGKTFYTKKSLQALL